MRLLSTLVAWADELGRDDIVRLLTTNLNEEKAARIPNFRKTFSRTSCMTAVLTLIAEAHRRA